ncbi:MAG: hypothetical protein KJN70_13175, partial [Eudoraea sp.]|nr:hypothetical protein [Eudoraea sp.]
FTIGSAVTVSITASSASGRIVKHQIFFNGKLVDTDGASFTPYKIGNIGAGNHVIKATVTDDGGAVSSKSVTFTATSTVTPDAPSTPETSEGNSAPTVSFLSPQKNQNYASGATVSVNLNGSDSDGRIVKYQIFVNGKLVDTDGSYFTPHKITDVKAGTYLVLAKVTDDNGSTASQSTSFNVSGSTQKQTDAIALRFSGDTKSFRDSHLQTKQEMADHFLKVSRNPVKEGRLLIRQKGNRYLRIIDLNGVFVKELKADRQKIEIDLSGLAPGLYLLSSDLKVVKFIID